MRAALVAPFASSTAVPLATLLLEGPHAVRERLAAGDLPGWTVLQPSAPEQPGLIFEHEPTGLTLVPRRLLSARLEAGARPELRPPGVDEVELGVGVHGVGCLVLWCDVANDAELTSLEEAACHQVPAVAAEVSRLVLGRLAGSTRRDATGRYPVDEFLWWHRVLVPEGPADRAAAERLLVGAQRPLSAGPRELLVGDGSTLLDGGTPDDTAAVVRGIVDAQEIWIAGETASREVVMQIAALQAAQQLSDAELHASSKRAVRVAESEELRAAVLQDQVRYTTGLRRETVEAAAAAWSMSLQLAPVSAHLSSLRGMLQRRVDDRRAQQERRIAMGVFALGVLSAFALVLAVFETAAGPVIDHQVGRLVVAGAVAVVAALSVWASTRFFRRPEA